MMKNYNNEDTEWVDICDDLYTEYLRERAKALECEKALLQIKENISKTIDILANI